MNHHAFANALLIDKLALLPSAPFQRHSATSRAAAKAIEPVAGTQRALIFRLIHCWNYTGVTDSEIGRELALPGDSVRPRRGELLKAGLIVDSGRTRKTASGREAVVWVATEYQT